MNFPALTKSAGFQADVESFPNEERMLLAEAVASMPTSDAIAAIGDDTGSTLRSLAEALLVAVPRWRQEHLRRGFLANLLILICAELDLRVPTRNAPPTTKGT